MKRYKFYGYLLIAFAAGYIANNEAVKRLLSDTGYFIKGILINDQQLINESLFHILYFFR